MKVPLLEYLDKLEATAKAAPPGNWTSKPHGGGRFAGAVISDERDPDEGYGGHLIAESCSPTVCVHMMATQPRATLALIAKLREAVSALKAYADDAGGSFAPPCDFENIEVPS